MKMALIGASGQLGSDLVKVLPSEDLVPLTHQDIEITDYAQVIDKLKSLQPDIVINTAAYNRVDDCEKNDLLAFQVNALGAKHIALACREIDARLVHISTDYVFDGTKCEPYTELDAPNPINAYGLSKLAGELYVKYILENYFIIRTAGLFGIAGSRAKGGNFVEAMLRLASEHREIRVVEDQIVSPTYTVDLARKISQIIKADLYGIYHITNKGQCSWFEFAREIFALSGIQTPLKPISSEELGATAKRPKYSALRNYALEKLGIDDLPPWQEALKTYLKERKKEFRTTD